jgi:hypothetical protein
MSSPHPKFPNRKQRMEPVELDSIPGQVGYGILNLDGKFLNLNLNLNFRCKSSIGSIIKTHGDIDEKTCQLVFTIYQKATSVTKESIKRITITLSCCDFVIAVADKNVFVVKVNS